ncbi:MAG TPA: hypothetical protein VJM33_04925 [Microthrixaceae bacterium]|nr:hypothetical protein [Microthrixaceae bacterium]
MAGGADRLTARLATGGPAHAIDPARPWTFGRSLDCDLPLGSDDTSISRTAGSISWAGSAWELRNLSSSRPLYRISDTGLRSPLEVGARLTVLDPVTRIAVVGSMRTHQLVLELEPLGGEGDAPFREQIPGTETMMPTFTANEFAGVVAMLEGYLLDHPRYEPRPRTYAEAAERLGLPAATVRKRIESVRTKLVEHGVVELQQPDARQALAEFVLSTRLVTPADLHVLDEASARGHSAPTQPGGSQ